jgi:hypothetical protein
MRCVTNYLLDELDVFWRVPGGTVPVLIIDGHESWLAPQFLRYINGEGLSHLESFPWHAIYHKLLTCFQSGKITEKMILWKHSE